MCLVYVFDVVTPYITKFHNFHSCLACFNAFQLSCVVFISRRHHLKGKRSSACSLIWRRLKMGGKTFARNFPPSCCLASRSIRISTDERMLKMLIFEMKILLHHPHGYVSRVCFHALIFFS